MKCAHGQHIPAGEAVALYCLLCNPLGIPDGPAPVLPRSSGDPLSVASHAAVREYCPTCECPRTYCGTVCRQCGHQFAPADQGRAQNAANVQQPGACPKCLSTIHYETNKKSKWRCADCGTVYPAAKGRKDDGQ